MLEISIKSGESNFQINQISPRPWIHLDHWALRHFSSTSQEKKRFLDLLERKGGTLCISWIAVFEIINHDKGKSLSDIIDFYRDLGNKFSFLQCNPMKVMNDEKNWKLGNTNPGLDMETAVSYFRNIFGNELRQISFSQVIETIINNQEAHKKMKEKLKEHKDTGLQEFSKHRNRYIKDPSKIAPKIKLETHLDVTSYIYYETLKQYVKGNSKIEPNDIPDIFYTIVPVSYCDFVMIDSKWVEFVRNTNPEKGIVSRIYSKKDLPVFFNDLDLFTESSIGKMFAQS